MKIVTGGRYSGKRSYVINILGIPEERVLDMKGKDIRKPSDIPEDTLALYHAEAFIRNCVAAGTDPYEIIKAFADTHADCVVVCDETGSGVIPLSPDEEAYREAVGRTMCRLTEEAGGLVRLTCGIPEELKR